MNDRAVAAKGYHWTTVEIAVLREHYPAAGPDRCAELLPHRGLHACYAKAQQLGLKAPYNKRGTTGKRFARKWPHLPHIEAQIVEGYRTAKRRGDLKAMAERIGRPKFYVHRRAVELGLTVERIAPEPWCDAELRVLEAAASCQIAVIRRKLAAAGFARTGTAIAVMLKRRGLDRTDPDIWSARDLGKLLGVDGGTVVDWIERRGLKAGRNTPGDKASPWRIKRRDLRAWLKANHGRVDLRRVDQPWLWELVL